jgi:hypothetical protein
MKLKLLLLVTAFYIFQTVNAATNKNVLFKDNLQNFKSNLNPHKGWKLNNLKAENISDALRITETGVKNYGNMHRYLPFNKDFPYLQITLGQIENSRHFASAANISSGGKPFGKLFQGCNTFSLKGQQFKSTQGSFALSIMQHGPRGTAPGCWLDLYSVKILKRPVGGLTVELEQNGKKDNIARIGDFITIKYFASPSCSLKSISIKVFDAKTLSPVKLSKAEEVILEDNGKNGDAKAGDKIYSCKIKIDSTATTLNIPFNRRCGGNIIVSADIKNSFTCGFSWFGFDIKTNNKLDLQLSASSPLVRKYRELWVRRTQGQNLALKKKVKISRRPNYRRFKKGETDSKDLTDGKISSRSDDRIWFDSRTVGWYQGATSGINFMIDLEKKQPIESIIIRCLGGKTSNSLSLPRTLEAFVSLDGKNFYKAASITKLMPAEAEQSDFKRYYYIPENGEAFAYPFKLDVMSEARYINLRIKGETGWFFTDEIAVIKANQRERKTSNFNTVYQKERPQKVYFSGIVAYSRPGKLVVSKNIITPNFLEIQDMRKSSNAKKPIKIIMELPEEFEVISPKTKVTDCLLECKKAKRWEIDRNSIRKFPLYIKVKKGILDSNKAVIYVQCADEPIHKIKMPIELIDIPVVPALKRLHVSLAWMSLASAKDWPGFFKSWTYLGFNAISCFPRYWNGKTSPSQQTFLKEARQRGLKIIMNESPFWGWQKMKMPAGAEIYSQFDGQKKSTAICPSYRGKYYQKEMDRIARCVELTNPDYVFWDIECWHKGVPEATQCTTCQKAIKSSKARSLAEYLQICGTEHMKDLHEAVKKGSAKNAMPLLATYDNEPHQPLYQQGLYNFNFIYPQYIEMAQPSLYVAGRAEDVKSSIRANHKLIKNKKIIPWLTAGTYGEFESYKLEQMILEALLNGAGGITYYNFSDFDTPLDFYYQAKALAEIAPYENLIVDGKVLEPTGSNKQLSYSGVRKGNEMLLLIGNYKKTVPETTIQLPFRKITEIKDLRSSNLIPLNNKLILNVPKAGIRLIYIKGTN